MGHVVDLLPTVLEMAGIKKEEIRLPDGAPPLPGESLVPSFEKDGAVVHSHIYFHHEGNRALRAGDWKIVNESNVNRGQPDNPWALYDLAIDRCEMEDLSGDYPEKLAEMVALWRECEEAYRTHVPAAQE